MEGPKGEFVKPPWTTLEELMSEGQIGYRKAKPGGGPKAPRKAGESWTKEEHLAFLKGLEACGKGQWTRIAREYVPSRTHTQIASHAQKHALRKAGVTKRRSKFQEFEAKAKEESEAPEALALLRKTCSKTARKLGEPASHDQGASGIHTNGMYQPPAMMDQGPTRIYKPKPSRPSQIFRGSAGSQGSHSESS